MFNRINSPIRPEDLRKYKINEYLESLTFKEYKIGIKIIPKLLNVSANTLYNWREIKMTDKEDIPAQKACMLEQLFGMEKGTLANYHPEIKNLKEYIREEYQQARVLPAEV